METIFDVEQLVYQRMINNMDPATSKYNQTDWIEKYNLTNASEIEEYRRNAYKLHGLISDLRIISFTPSNNGLHYGMSEIPWWKLLINLCIIIICVIVPPLLQKYKDDVHETPIFQKGKTSFEIIHEEVDSDDGIDTDSASESDVEELIEHLDLEILKMDSNSTENADSNLTFDPTKSTVKRRKKAKTFVQKIEHLEKNKIKLKNKRQLNKYFNKEELEKIKDLADRNRHERKMLKVRSKLKNYNDKYHYGLQYGIKHGKISFLDYIMWPFRSIRSRIFWKLEVYKFYRAPIIIFIEFFLSQLLLVTCFSYFLMERYCDSPHLVEYCLIFYIICMTLEEFRQLCRNGTSISDMVVGYITDIWNIMDAISIFCFLTGFGLRLRIAYTHPHDLFFSRLGLISACPTDMTNATDRFLLAKNLYCFGFFFLCLRLLNVFTITEQLGPLIIMIKKMMIDMAKFLVVLAIFILSYGVITQSLKFSNEVFDEYPEKNSILQQMFFRPYWELYGEMTFLEEEHNPNDPERECGPGPDQPRCAYLPEGITWVSVIYMLLANVLLLNLLIALFASTYEKVTDQSDKLWKISRSYLVIEYRDKPTLPVPFCIFTELKFLALLTLNIIEHLVQNKKIGWGGSSLEKFKFNAVDRNTTRKLLTLERIAAEDVEDDEKLKAEYDSKLDFITETLGEMRKDMDKLRAEAKFGKK